jgi:hypothetical protein
MKLIKINIIAALALFTVMAFTACSKDDGAIPERISIEDVPAVSINLEIGNGLLDTIPMSGLPNFQNTFKASMFFTGAKPPEKIDIMVRKNKFNTTITNANVKVFKTDINSLPATFTITVAEIEALFGGPVAHNDLYDFGPDLYVGAKKYEAFPATGLGSGQGVSGMGAVGFGEFVRFRVMN